VPAPRRHAGAIVLSKEESWSDEKDSLRGGTVLVCRGKANDHDAEGALSAAPIPAGHRTPEGVDCVLDTISISRYLNIVEQWR
jgi:hypothetical protein